LVADLPLDRHMPPEIVRKSRKASPLRELAPRAQAAFNVSESRVATPLPNYWQRGVISVGGGDRLNRAANMERALLSANDGNGESYRWPSNSIAQDARPKCL